MKFTTVALMVFLFCIQNVQAAKVDSIRFNNGDLLLGEIKSLKKGVLVVETPYSDNDFEIEWDKVVWLRTQSEFLVTTEHGGQFFSNIISLNDTISIVLAENNLLIQVNTHEIVFLSPYKDSFKDRLSAYFDIGYEMAKAKHLKRLSMRGGIGYQAPKWNSNIKLSTLISTQDDADDIKRTENEVNFRYILGQRWYTIATFKTYSNTEQLLDLRLNTQIGFARYLVMTDKTYWGLIGGLNRNYEMYTDGADDRVSFEAYFTTELDLYNVKDFTLTYSSTVFPSITEKGRWRMDNTVDLKYDLPLDFYIKFGATLNYDNQPVEGVSKLDYVMQTGLGWEW